VHYAVDGDETVYNGTLGLTPIHSTVMKRTFEVITARNLMHMLDSDNTAVEQLVDTDSNVRFLAMRMDAMVAHTLAPEDELVAGPDPELRAGPGLGSSPGLCPKRVTN
jgi:hypothetical protein